MELTPLRQKTKRLLLATDLSARGDRALDRAAMLAVEWDASLTVVHAIEAEHYEMTSDRHPGPSWRQSSDPNRAIALKRVCQDLGHLDVPFDVVLGQGAPSDVILHEARDLDVEMIVTGIGGGETFGRLVFGGTVDRLVRNASVPVLVVKTRARHAYRDIVVATNFSEASRKAIDATASMYPDARITLLHCYDATPSSMMSPIIASTAGRQMAMAVHEEFINAVPESAQRLSRLPILFERGTVDSIVKAYVADKSLDLLVIGSQGKNVFTRALFGSTAERMMASAPADVLVVPPGGPARVPDAEVVLSRPAKRALNDPCRIDHLRGNIH
jgi:nucleotide-binding universal stress UspA family protein